MFSVWPRLLWSSGDCKRRCSGLSALLAVSGSFALEHTWHRPCSAAWRAETASGSKAQLDPLQTLSLPLGLAHPGRDCALGPRPSLCPPPFPGERGMPGGPVTRLTAAGSHLPSLPAARCSLYPFSSSGLSPRAMEHSGSAGPWQLSLSSFPGATSSSTHSSTVTSAHPFPRGVPWTCPVRFPSEGQSPCTVISQEEAGAPCIPFLSSFSSEGHVPVWHLIFSTAILELKGKLHV